MTQDQLTLAATYLLLLLDDDKGKLLVDKRYVDTGLAAATLLDLIGQGHLALDADGKPGKQRLHATGVAPADPDLAEVVRTVQDRKFGNAVEKLAGFTSFTNHAKSLRERELHRLVSAGILGAEKARVLGLFPVDRYPSLDDAVERDVRGRLEDVLARGATPDERSGALISLLYAVGALPKVFPHLDKGDLKRPGKEISAGNWAGEQVAQAINNMTAVIVAIMAATTATSASASVTSSSGS
jgi:hypothetical protein